MSKKIRSRAPFVGTDDDTYDHLTAYLSKIPEVRKIITPPWNLDR